MRWLEEMRVRTQPRKEKEATDVLLEMAVSPAPGDGFREARVYAHQSAPPRSAWYEVIATGAVDCVERTLEASKPDLVLFDPYVEGKCRWDILESIRACRKGASVMLCLAFDVREESWLFGSGDHWVIESCSTAGLISKVEALLA